MAQIIMLCSLYTKDKIGVYPLKEMLIFVIHLHRQLSFFFHPKALVIILCLYGISLYKSYAHYFVMTFLCSSYIVNDYFVLTL